MFERAPIYTKRNQLDNGFNTKNYEEDYTQSSSGEDEKSSSESNSIGGKTGRKIADAMNRKTPNRGYQGRG